MRRTQDSRPFSQVQWINLDLSRLLVVSNVVSNARAHIVLENGYLLPVKLYFRADLLQAPLTLRQCTEVALCLWYLLLFQRRFSRPFNRRQWPSLFLWL